eukprot:340400_1
MAINYTDCENNHSFVFDLLFENHWFKTDVLNGLFENLEQIRIKNVNICTLLMESIFSYLSDKRRRLNLLEIKLYPKANNDLDIPTASLKYKEKYSDIGYVLQYKAASSGGDIVKMLMNEDCLHIVSAYNTSLDILSLVQQAFDST